MINKIKRNDIKGITLISLVITIIVLIILAAISIKLLLGSNGIIERAKQAKNNTIIAQEEEANRLNELYSSIMVATGEGANITISMQDLNTLIENKVKEQLNNSNTSSVPAGTVISYITGTSAPEGYLKCDGTVYNITEYQTLADSIKNGLGSYNYYGGDGETTFAVPDLRGEFLRGTGRNVHNNSGNGADVGVHQDSTAIIDIILRQKNYAVPLSTTATENIQGANFDSSYPKANLTYGFYNNSTSSSKYADATGSNALRTIRPTNTSVLYCIKY